MAVSILGAPGMSSALEGKLLISILAGVTIEQLTSMVPASTRVVRAMPNTPCRIREGMTVVSAIPSSSSPTPSKHDLQLELDRSIILAIFSSIGRCRFLDEKHFDACTALSGSGPAFACIVLEAMADGGVMMGLPRTEALELAAQSKSNSTLYAHWTTNMPDLDLQRCRVPHEWFCNRRSILRKLKTQLRVRLAVSS